MKMFTKMLSGALCPENATILELKHACAHAFSFGVNNFVVRFHPITSLSTPTQSFISQCKPSLHYSAD